MVQELSRIVVVIVQPALEQAMAEVLCASVAEAKVNHPTCPLSLGGGASLFKWVRTLVDCRPSNDRSRKGQRFFSFFFFGGGNERRLFDGHLVTPLTPFLIRLSNPPRASRRPAGFLDHLQEPLSLLLILMNISIYTSPSTRFCRIWVMAEI